MSISYNVIYSSENFFNSQAPEGSWCPRARFLINILAVLSLNKADIFQHFDKTVQAEP